MDYNDEESKQISKYNDASFSISRLHESWLRCNRYIRSGIFKKWKIELDTIWLELFPDVLRQTDSKELIKKNVQSMKLVALSKNRNEMFFNLMERHQFLRQVQDASGKGGVYVDEDEEGFE